jgi:hypothetical protein
MFYSSKRGVIAGNPNPFLSIEGDPICDKTEDFLAPIVGSYPGIDRLQRQRGLYANEPA